MRKPLLPLLLTLACAADPAPPDAGTTIADAGTVLAVCGNARVEVGEGCDDGNTTPGDGCDGTCRAEAGVLGCRTFAISEGKDGNTRDSAAYRTTATNPDSDISELLTASGYAASGPLLLCAGELSAGKAPLTLQADVTVAISLPLDNCLCRQLLADASSGFLFCAPSSDPLDTRVSIDSRANGPALQAVATLGPGAVPGEGHLLLALKSRSTNMSVPAAGCTPAACATAVGGIPLLDVTYTTGTAISAATQTVQGGDIEIMETGAPFDDDPQDGTPDCEDWASGGDAGRLAGAAGFGEDEMALGGTRDVVTIERLAP